jgi:hypothetical protein
VLVAVCPADTDGAGGAPFVVAGLTDSQVSSAFLVLRGKRIDLPVAHGAFLWSPDDAGDVDRDISVIGVVMNDGSTQVVGT